MVCGFPCLEFVLNKILGSFQYAVSIDILVQ